MTQPNIWIIDIETAPRIAYVWQFFKAFISPNQVLNKGYIMSFAAKKLGEDSVIYEETRTEDDTELCRSLSAIFDNADIVIAHNADRFDIPTIRASCMRHGLRPWSPIKVIDTLKVAKREFRIDSNSLKYLSMYLGVDEKEDHAKFPGFELWKECIAGNEEAWAEMQQYNIQDVLTLEQVYLKMRPWMTRHPNLGVLMEEDKTVCSKCSSDHIQWRGYAYTNVGKYRKYQCQGCGGWGRSRFTEYDPSKKKVLTVNAV
tara:strand:- start:4771 stop:5544 length:774 start_codon:yes stop_codon:yes gene_type:complete